MSNDIRFTESQLFISLQNLGSNVFNNYNNIFLAKDNGRKKIDYHCQIVMNEYNLIDLAYVSKVNIDKASKLVLIDDANLLQDNYCLLRKQSSDSIPQVIRENLEETNQFINSTMDELASELSKLSISLINSKYTLEVDHIAFKTKEYGKLKVYFYANGDLKGVIGENLKVIVYPMVALRHIARLDKNDYPLIEIPPEEHENLYLFVIEQDEKFYEIRGLNEKEKKLFDNFVDNYSFDNVLKALLIKGEKTESQQEISLCAYNENGQIKDKFFSIINVAVTEEKINDSNYNLKNSLVGFSKNDNSRVMIENKKTKLVNTDIHYFNKQFQDCYDEIIKVITMFKKYLSDSESTIKYHRYNSQEIAAYIVEHPSLTDYIVLSVEDDISEIYALRYRTNVLYLHKPIKKIF